jgi:hypothetical protein
VIDKMPMLLQPADHIGRGLRVVFDEKKLHAEGQFPIAATDNRVAATLSSPQRRFGSGLSMTSINKAN